MNKIEIAEEFEDSGLIVHDGVIDLVYRMIKGEVSKHAVKEGFVQVRRELVLAAAGELIKAVGKMVDDLDEQLKPSEPSDPSVADSILAGKILTLLGRAQDPSLEPGADPMRDRVAALLAAERG